jgi:3-oxoacyl-[acyl-carrier-protein] synthase-3
VSFAKIVGTGSYLPARVLTNEELAKSVDTSDAWIVSRTGIRERHIAAEGELTSDMAVQAARRALEMADVPPAALDMIVVGTITPDMPMPACATFIQRALGANRAFAFDLSAACAGSIYGLSIASNYLKNGVVKRALVIGVEMLSRVTDWSDRNTCVLFADGAGAMVLAPPSAPDRGILSTHLHTDGNLAELLTIRGGGTKHPQSQAVIDGKLNTIAMAGREVYKVAVRYLGEALEEALAANGVVAAQVDRVIAHQANLRILEAVLERHGIPLSKAWINIDRCGNTSSASLPMTLDEALRGGAIRDGDLIAMVALGAGISWGSALVRW